MCLSINDMLDILIPSLEFVASSVMKQSQYVFVVPEAVINAISMSRTSMLSSQAPLLQDQTIIASSRVLRRYQVIPAVMAI